MENTHETTIPDGFYKDSISGMITSKHCSCGRKNQQINECECQKPKGMLGWVCPVCGRGNSPFSSACPCVSFPQFSARDITFGQNQSSNQQ